MEVMAKHRYAHISPQKVRLVVDQIRGLSVEQAATVLRFSTKKAAAIVKKVLDSAIANAEHNKGLDVDNLFVSVISVDKSVTLKRIKPRARGRADRFFKRSCNIELTLGEVV